MDFERDINPTTLKLMRAFKEFHRASWQEHPVGGCKPSEIRVLFCIKHGMKLGATNMKVSEISKFLHVTSPSVTQLLKGLEANGLIERHIDPVDRRAVDIQLTTKGDDLTKQALEGYARSLDGLVAYLGEDESDHLAELIAKVFRYYKERETNTGSSQQNGDEEV